MVSIKDAVYDQFYLSEEDGGVVSKRRYFYDMFHPTNVGHRIMADGLINMFRVADASADEEDLDISGIKPPKGAEFENIRFVDRSNIDSCSAVISYDCGEFNGHSDEVQFVERNMDLAGTPEFNENWLYDGKGGEAVFRAKIKCSALVVAYMDSASPEVGTAEVYVNGEKKLTIDPHIIGWAHCNAYIAHRGGPSAEYEIEIRVVEKDKRFTFLGFGVVD